MPMEAMHLLGKMRTGALRSTLDADLQGRVNALARRYNAQYRGNRINNLAVVVMDVRSGEVLAYAGNVYDPEGGTTFCPTCATPVIRRDRYVIDSYALDDHGCCTVCGTRIPGRFNAHSGSGRRRMPHRITIH